MSHHQSGNLLSIILGTATAASIGSILFQAIGVFALALIGAFAGWVFNAVIKPYLEKKFKKKA